MPPLADISFPLESFTFPPAAISDTTVPIGISSNSSIALSISDLLSNPISLASSSVNSSVELLSSIGLTSTVVPPSGTLKDNSALGIAFISSTMASTSDSSDSTRLSPSSSTLNLTSSPSSLSSSDTSCSNILAALSSIDSGVNSVSPVSAFIASTALVFNSDLASSSNSAYVSSATVGSATVGSATVGSATSSAKTSSATTSFLPNSVSSLSISLIRSFSLTTKLGSLPSTLDSKFLFSTIKLKASLASLVFKFSGI